jgi:hypothetical protein
MQGGPLLCVHAVTLSKLEECINLCFRRIVSNICLYSFKYFIHPINPHVIIMFIFYYDSSKINQLCRLLIEMKN